MTLGSGETVGGVPSGPWRIRDGAPLPSHSGSVPAFLHQYLRMSSVRSFVRTHARSVVGGGLLILALGAYLIDWSDPPSLILFLGTLHPVVVHLPIGFLLLAALLEGLHRYDDRYAFVKPTISLVLALGALTAVAAAGAGWFLSLTGGYEGTTIWWHQWLGVGVAIGGVAAWGLERLARSETAALPRAESGYLAVLVVTVAALGVTGHLGGTLTHGSGFLTQYLPASVRAWTGGPAAARAGDLPVPIDSAVVYRDLIRPIFRDRCVECHGPNKREGDLRLDGPEHLEEGGESGPAVTPGEPEQSELLRRVTLPLYHDDVMPPEDHEPLSVERVELLRWWIANGASFEATVAELRGESTPPPVKTVLTRLSRPREEIKTGIYAEEVSPPDSSAIDELADAPFRIRKVARDEPFLQIEVRPVVDTVDAALLRRLEGLAPQIAWLDLSGTAVPASALEVVGTFPHLTRLYLRGASIEATGLPALADNTFLTYLNLVGADVSDDGLAHLASVSSLETLYLWQTAVSDAAVDSLRAQLSGLDVNRGATLVVHDSTRTDTVRTDTAGATRAVREGS